MTKGKLQRTAFVLLSLVAALGCSPEAEKQDAVDNVRSEMDVAAENLSAVSDDETARTAADALEIQIDQLEEQVSKITHNFDLEAFAVISELAKKAETISAEAKRIKEEVPGAKKHVDRIEKKLDALGKKLQAKLST